MKLGRNDICHCGSGKKYKRCCRQIDLQNQRALQTIKHPRDWFLHHSSTVSEQMSAQLGEHTAIQSARLNWNSAGSDTADALFQQHALYDLAVTSTGPLITKAKASLGQITSEDLTALTSALSQSHMSLLHVDESKRGKGVRLSDALTGTTYFVALPNLAETLEPMEVIVGRVCQWKEEYILLSGWEKVRFHGRKKAISNLCSALEQDGFEDGDAEERIQWLRREASKVALMSREA